MFVLLLETMYDAFIKLRGIYNFAYFKLYAFRWQRRRSSRLNCNRHSLNLLYLVDMQLKNKVVLESNYSQHRLLQAYGGV